MGKQVTDEETRNACHDRLHDDINDVNDDVDTDLHRDTDDKDDEDLTLSLPPDTLALLQSFLDEQKQAQEKFEQLKRAAETQFQHNSASDDILATSANHHDDLNPLTSSLASTSISHSNNDLKSSEPSSVAAELDISDFSEDWQLSQFWYSDETALFLAQKAIDITPYGGYIGCVSSPSVYVKLAVRNFSIML